jgi:hypothetical protein
MVTKPDFSHFPTMPVNQDTVQLAQQTWDGYEEALRLQQLQTDEAYRQHQHQQNLLGALPGTPATKPLTPCGKNFTLPTSSSTHRPIGGQHGNIGDRRARGFRRTRLDEIDLRTGLRDIVELDD